MTVRSYHHSEFPADRLRDERIESISVCVPAREEALTIAGVVEPLVALREAGVVDQVLVVDGNSADGTARDRGCVRRRGAAAGVAARGVRTRDRQGRRDVARAERHDRRARVLRRRRHRGLRRALRLRAARPARVRPARAVRQGLLPPSLSGREHRRVGRRRSRHGAHRAAAARGVLSRAVGHPSAAGRRDGGPARAARARRVLDGLRGRDGPAARRLPRGRPRRDGAGRPRRAPEPPPAARRPRADGGRSARGGTTRLRREGRLADDAVAGRVSNARRSPSCAPCAASADQVSSRSQTASSASVARRRAPGSGRPSPNVSTR